MRQPEPGPAARELLSRRAPALSRPVAHMEFIIAAARGHLTPDDRAYAEYRIFSALGRLADHVTLVWIEFDHAPTAGSARRVTCLVRVASALGAVAVRRSAPLLSRAVDLAAARLALVAGDVLGGSPVSARAADRSSPAGRARRRSAPR